MPSPTIYDRIADHAAAIARFENSCDPADELSAKARGTVVTAEAIAEHEAANAAEVEAFDALLSHVATNIVELRRQIGYLQYFLKCTDTLDRDQLDRLFFALLDFRPRNA